MSHKNNCESCNDACTPCAPDTGACDVREQNYFVNACADDKGHSSKTPGKSTGKVRLWVQDYGDLKAPVIVLPDGVLAPQQFEYQIKPLVDAGFRVVAITPRGMGDSDKPFGPYNLDVWADDLHAVIEQLKLDDFVLVGSTPLSRISVRYLSRHGCKRVKSAFFHSPNALSGVFPFIAPGLKAAIQVDRENTIDSLTSLVFAPIVITAAQRAWSNQLLFKLPIPVWLGFFDSLLEDLTAELKCVCVCVLGIVGEFDQFNPVSEAQTFIAGVPNGKLIVVPGQGHGIQITDPTTYNSNLIAFAKACDPCLYLANYIPVPPPPGP